MNTWKILSAITIVAGCGVDGTNGGTGPSGGRGGLATGGSSFGANAGGSSVPPAAGAGGSAPGVGGSAGAGLAGSASCTPGVPPTSQIPRLTNAQYDRTVRDLLGVTALTAHAGSVPSNLLATDQAGGLTDIAWAAYQTVGEAIAEQVMADPALRPRFITCDPAVSGCLHDTVASFGRKAFRRPLVAEEIAAFDAVIAKGSEITPTGAPGEVAQALLYLFLVSPSFLQRSELREISDGAGHFTLSSFEVASRLSYLLWGSTPDDALDLAADAQQLETPTQILVQAQRMVEDEKARDVIGAFHRSYLLMGTNTRWDNTNKDPVKYPAFDRNLVGLLQQETEMFFDHVVFAKNGTFEDLLQSPVAFVSSATAPLYGLDPAKFTTNLTETTLEGRPGFITRAGFLNAYSGYEGTSPILRGAFISKQVLGISIGAPPPGAEQTPLPPASAELDTNRKRYAAMTSGPQCAGCHVPLVNPPGFALESFDTVGAWQTMEHDTGAPIDDDADILLAEDGPAVHVSGPVELMAAIASAPGAKAQYASRLVSFSTGRAGHPDDACTVRELAAKMTASGYTILHLVTDLTQTLSFRVRTAEP
jgi:hypothetical protein